MENNGRKAIDEVRREYVAFNNFIKSYIGNQTFFPTTKSTLGMLIMGEDARQKKEYSRSFEIYYDVFRRLNNGQRACVENVSEVSNEDYRYLTARRLERLVKAIEQDDSYSPNKYFVPIGLPVIDSAKKLITDMANNGRR